MYSWAEHTAGLDAHKIDVKESFGALARQIQNLPDSPALTFARSNIAEMAVLFRESDSAGQFLVPHVNLRTPEKYKANDVANAFATLTKLATAEGDYSFPIENLDQRALFVEKAKAARIYMGLAAK